MVICRRGDGGGVFFDTLVRVVVGVIISERFVDNGLDSILSKSFSKCSLVDLDCFSTALLIVDSMSLDCDCLIFCISVWRSATNLLRDLICSSSEDMVVVDCSAFGIVIVGFMMDISSPMHCLTGIDFVSHIVVRSRMDRITLIHCWRARECKGPS